MPARKILPLVLVMAAMASCQMAGSGAGVVAISGFSFQPAMTTISGGVSLTWTNYDSATHTVTTDSGVTPAFDSGNITPFISYSLVLTLPGTYAYHCSIHTSMRGTIIVQ
jgi:plastocyanin